MQLRSGAVIALAVFLAGCGTAARKTDAHRPERNVKPREVEHVFGEVGRAFPALHFRLVDSGAYTNRDTPVIREYALNVGRGSTNVGALWVYATAKEAAADQSFDPTRGAVRRANLIAVFDPGIPRRVRNILTAVLDAAAAGSGRIRGHSLRA